MDERSIALKPLLATEKCFSDMNISEFEAHSEFYMFKNGRVCFQVAYAKETADLDAETPAELKITSEISENIELYSVEEVPVYKPCYPDADDNYLRKQPGFFPDLLMPAKSRHRVFFSRLRAFFVIVKGNLEPKKYPIEFSFYHEGKLLGSTTVQITVVNAALPPQKLLYTNWFYNDCLAGYYGCEMYSKRHWQIIENYIKEAVYEGVNMILTPVLTPPLDTGRGWYRDDVGLVDITKTEKGYSFSYKNLDRWIEICERCGIKRFEISHLFCQHTAAHPPQVTAWLNGKKQRIFGWDTDAQSPEYVEFIRIFLKKLIAHLKKKGTDKKCFFHIADEPGMDVFDSYTAAKRSVADLLEGYPVIDALSELEFFKSGQIKMPVPAITEAESFFEFDLPMRWTYYCCAQHISVPNRFIAMTGNRTEMLGVLLYKYAVDGFLHWGFNFYNGASSWHMINPFVDLSGDNWVPAGDTFCVYPAPDGTPYRSLHGMQFSDGLETLRLLQYCERLIGREKTLEIVGDVSFTEYPKDANYLYGLKKYIFEIIGSNKK